MEPLNKTRALLYAAVVSVFTLISSSVNATLIPADLSIESNICFGTGCAKLPPIRTDVTYNGQINGIGFNDSDQGASSDKTFTETGDNAEAYISNAITGSEFFSELSSFNMYFSFSVLNNSATDSFDVTFGLDFFLEAYANVMAFDPNAGPQSSPIGADSLVDVYVGDSNGSILSNLIELGGGGNTINGTTFPDQYGGYYQMLGSDSFSRSLAAGSSYNFFGSFSVSLDDENFNPNSTAMGTASLSVELLDVTNTTPISEDPTANIPEPSLLHLMLAGLIGLLVRRRKF